MAQRKIVKVDEAKCNGCGLCVPNCKEGALQVVNGKARLVSEVYCDGLGACLGECPQGAITIEEREAADFNEARVKEHLAREGLSMGRECGCPGAAVREFKAANAGGSPGDLSSQLRQWPVQLHLVPPGAPYFQGRDVLLAADCVAYALGDFHQNYLQGKGLAIACPKLDDGQDVYLAKLIALIDQARINTLTVMVMEVPCCGGLLQLAKTAQAQAKRKVPVKVIVIGLQGAVLKEDWVS